MTYPVYWYDRMSQRTAEQKLLGHIQVHGGNADPKCPACRELQKAAESENPSHD